MGVLYFVFVVTFFTFRQRGDDKLCAEKYGEEKWAEYKSKVKYRIFLEFTEGTHLHPFCQVIERTGGMLLHALDQASVDGPRHAGAR